MQQFLQEILSLNERHITPGERKAILDRVRESHFDNQLIWQEIKRQQGWYDAYAVLLILLIAFKDHLLKCEEEGVRHDPKPEFVAMREWIDTHWVADSYSSIIDKLRDALHDVEREKEVADFYRNGYNDQKAQIKDLTEQVRYWKARAEANSVNPAERNELTFDAERLARLRKGWAKPVKDMALREEVIFRLSQARDNKEMAERIMAELFADERVDFNKMTTKEIALLVKDTVTYEDGLSDISLQRAIGAVRPKKKGA